MSSHEQTMTIPLSILVLTRNEETKLAECLDSVQGLGEIVVVDSLSSDATLDIARRYTDQIYPCPFEGFGSQRNYGLDRCRGEWVMMLDADERFTPELRAEVNQIVSQPQLCAGFWVSRRNIVFGKWLRHGGVYPDYTLRFWQRARGRYVEQIIHELPQINGIIGRLKCDLIHLSYPDISRILTNQDRYSKLLAQQLRAEGRRWHRWDITLKPLYVLFHMIVIRMAWRDGWQGVTYAILSSYSMFLKHAMYRELMAQQEAKR
jgi:glycosyltransferase involved in cell wall biosynthesis